MERLCPPLNISYAEPHIQTHDSTSFRNCYMVQNIILQGSSMMCKILLDESYMRKWSLGALSSQPPTVWSGPPNGHYFTRNLHRFIVEF